MQTNNPMNANLFIIITLLYIKKTDDTAKCHQSLGVSRVKQLTLDLRYSFTTFWMVPSAL
jgi:hypothetical protein